MCSLSVACMQMDNFRTPNFPLVADSLYWLLLRYDPNIKISDDIDTETQRVTFLTAAAAFMAAKARVQLKTKNLYYADGRAVKELLKVARLLYRCVTRHCPSLLAYCTSCSLLSPPAVRYEVYKVHPPRAMLMGCWMPPWRTPSSQASCPMRDKLHPSSQRKELSYTSCSGGKKR